MAKIVKGKKSFCVDTFSLTRFFIPYTSFDFDLLSSFHDSPSGEQKKQDRDDKVVVAVLPHEYESTNPKLRRRL